MSGVNASWTTFAMDRVLAEVVIISSWRDIDKHGGAGVAEMFVDSGTLEFGEAVNRGRDEIALVYEQRRARGTRTSRHVVTNVHVEAIVDGWRAEYVCILYAADGAPVLVGTSPVGVYDVADELVTDAGRLRIRRRVLRPLFSGGQAAVSFDRPARELRDPHWRQDGENS